MAGAQRSMDGFGTASNRASAAAEGHKLSLGRVERALATYVGHAAGANAVTESLSVAFGSFAVGGGVVAGALIGIGAIVAIYEKLTEASKKAAEEQANLSKSLADMFRPKTGQGSVVNDAYEAAKAQQADARQKLRDLAVNGGPLGADQGAIDLQTERLRVANQAIGRAEARGTTPLSAVSITGESAAAVDAALQKRIDILTKGVVFENTRAKVTSELVGLEHDLGAEVNDGNLSLEKRITAMQRLGQVMDALSQKFTRSSTTSNTTLTSLIGITGNGDTPGARALAAFGGPMGNVKMGTGADGLLVQQGQADLIGAQQVLNMKSLENADRNAQNVRDAIWGAGIQSAQIIVNALNIGGGGKGSSIGGAIGSTGGFALGMFLTGGSPIGGAIGSTLGNMFGSFVGGLFDNSAATRENSNATRQLTAALLQNTPSGFKIEPYRYGASDPKGMMDSLVKYKTRGGTVRLGT